MGLGFRGGSGGALHWVQVAERASFLPSLASHSGGGNHTFISNHFLTIKNL